MGSGNVPQAIEAWEKSLVLGPSADAYMSELIHRDLASSLSFLVLRSRLGICHVQTTSTCKGDHMFDVSPGGIRREVRL